ncbi:uncharacterized protein (TIGR00661 family) [Neolewinella xylanilytica]|uniref:Uncharacterized protein (TIGR00661 family) n=1 Tax=Neolewinella xylanilytica TaxID=1514080 RepID=A0A2S6I9J2_9BACT|nr:glycosyltransferase family protein [Neolewinella xylanilytica]PPK88177.1 uncharacterized protein (TIGR00661 family) [Neolewinella xylanilytica]
MRILYAIQGTGNGHLSRAIEFVPALRRRPGLEVDVLLSGSQTELEAPFRIDYRLGGLGFVFGHRGGIDLRETLRALSVIDFLREVRTLPVHRYDLVINDFEPVSAWAARRAGVPSFALSHQYAVARPGAPRPRGLSPLALAFLRWYAPCAAGAGFHFRAYEPGMRPPVIREEVRRARVADYGHHTVYLPAIAEDQLVRVFSRFPLYRFEVFSKRRRVRTRIDNVDLYPVGRDTFLESMATSRGVICGGGFETPAEALFLGKRLLVVPMRNQFEQRCNAVALRELGVMVLDGLGKKDWPRVGEWLRSEAPAPHPFANDTEEIIDSILSAYGPVDFGSRALSPA